MGTPQFAVPTLDALARSGVRLVGVYTQPDRPSGRGKKAGKPPVKVLAETLGLSVFQPETLSTSQARCRLEALRPDVIVVAAYGLILPNWTLQLPTHRALNVHPSLLPRHRGPAPVANAILQGDESTGVTVMLVEPKVDSGPVLRSASAPIGPDDTTGSLSEKLSGLGARLLVETLTDWIAGRIVPQPQDEALATFSSKASKSDGDIDWTMPAEQVHRRIRAYHPWPGAFTFWERRRLKVIDALPIGGSAVRPGLVARVAGGIIVETGEGLLALKKVQPEGRRAMDIEAFLAGHPRIIGATLGPRPRDS